MSLTPEDYQLIAKEAYQVQESNKEGYVWEEGNIIPVNGTNWQVLKVKDNPTYQIDRVKNVLGALRVGKIFMNIVLKSQSKSNGIKL